MLISRITEPVSVIICTFLNICCQTVFQRLCWFLANDVESTNLVDTENLFFLPYRKPNKQYDEYDSTAFFFTLMSE